MTPPPTTEMEKLLKELMISSRGDGYKVERISSYIDSLQARNAVLEEGVRHFSSSAVSLAQSVVSHIRYEGHSTMNAENDLEELKSHRKELLTSLTPNP